LIDASFDAADCLRRYRDLLSRQGELFVNPPGMGYDILTMPGEVCAAEEAGKTQPCLTGAGG
jgi:hypothetical protein